MRLGFIGTGNMGTVLIESLITGKAVTDKTIGITNRTPEKAQPLLDKHPGITYYHKLEKIVTESDILFFCVKQNDLFTILKQIKPYLSQNQCFISLASAVTTEQLETWFPASWIRLIPSITNRALAGTFLLTFGKNCHPRWKKTVRTLLEKVGNPIEIDNRHVRIAADIASCGPAFLSLLLQKMVSGAVKKANIDEQFATELASQMLIGTAKLLEKNHYTLQELQEKVLVKGGITGEGIKVLEEGRLTELFEAVFTATAEKARKDAEEARIYFESE